MSALNGQFRGHQPGALQYWGIHGICTVPIHGAVGPHKCSQFLGAAYHPPSIATVRQDRTEHDATRHDNEPAWVWYLHAARVCTECRSRRACDTRSTCSSRLSSPGSANPRPTRAPVDLSPYCVRTVPAGAYRVQVLALLRREPILPPDCANAAATSGLARVDRQRRQGSIGAASPGPSLARGTGQANTCARPGLDTMTPLAGREALVPRQYPLLSPLAPTDVLSRQKL